MAEIHTLRSGEPSEKTGYCETPTSRDINNLLTSCQHMGLLGVIAGHPGVGKSTAIGAYEAPKRLWLSRIYRCRMTKAAQNLQPGLLRIAHSLGADAAGNCSGYELFDAVVRELERCECPLLILDEAQHMTDELLEAVRDIYDSAQPGIVLVGHRDLEERWFDRTSKRRYSYFAQLRGRIGMRLTIDAPSKADIDAICAHHGVTGQRERKMVATAAKAPGKLHTIDKLLRLAADLSDDGRITLDSLNQAASITGVTQ